MQPAKKRNFIKIIPWLLAGCGLFCIVAVILISMVINRWEKELDIASATYAVFRVR